MMFNGKPELVCSINNICYEKVQNLIIPESIFIKIKTFLGKNILKLILTVTALYIAFLVMPILNSESFNFNAFLLKRHFLYHMNNSFSSFKNVNVISANSNVLNVLNEIKSMTKGLQGTYGIYVKSLTRDEEFGLNQNEEFTAASVNKIPVLVKTLQEIDRGKVSLSSRYILRDEDIKNYGAGVIQFAPSGSVYSYNDLLTLSGRISDNTAAWILIGQIGKEKIQKFLNKSGFRKTSIDENTTTPKEISLLLSRIYKGDILSEESRLKLFHYLTNSIYEDRLPAGVPSTIQVVHKVGTEVQTINDCGIVLEPNNPYVISILSKNVNIQEAYDVLPKISRLIWQYESGSN